MSRMDEQARRDAMADAETLGPHPWIRGEPRRDGEQRYHRVKEILRRKSVITGCGSLVLYRAIRIEPVNLLVFTPCRLCFRAVPALRGE